MNIFLTSRIDQLLLKQLTNVPISPQKVLIINIDDLAIQQLAHNFSSASIKRLSFTELEKTTLFDEEDSVDLLVADFSIDAPTDIQMFFRKVKAVLSYQGIFIFGILDTVSFNRLIPIVANNSSNLLNELTVEQYLKQVQHLFYYSLKKHLIFDGNEKTIDCIIFFVSKSSLPEEIMHSDFSQNCHKTNNEESTAKEKKYEFQEKNSELDESDLEEKKENSEAEENDFEVEKEATELGEVASEEKEENELEEIDFEAEKEATELEKNESENEKEEIEQEQDDFDAKDEIEEKEYGFEVEKEETEQDENDAEAEKEEFELEKNDLEAKKEETEQEENDAELEKEEFEFEENEFEVEKESSEREENNFETEKDKIELKENDIEMEKENDELEKNDHLEKKYKDAEENKKASTLETQMKMLHETLTAHSKKLAEHVKASSELVEKMSDSASSDEAYKHLQTQLKFQQEEHQKLLAHYQFLHQNHGQQLKYFFSWHEEALKNNNQNDYYHTLIQQHQILHREHENNIEQNQKFLMETSPLINLTM